MAVENQSDRRLVLRGAVYPGDIAIAGGRIESVGVIAPEPGDRVLNCDGAIVTPGLINTHHHLFQTITRGHAANCSLYDWLRSLYPIWESLTADDVYVAAVAGLSRLALSGCTTTADHHYLVLNGMDDMFDAIVAAARAVGIRLHLVRGGVDMGISTGGFAPDSFVESIDGYLDSAERLVNSSHDGERISIALGPGNPLMVSNDLMRQCAALADERGLGLHTHFAEVAEERGEFLEMFGCSPLQILERTNWLGPNVWLAHGIHLSDVDISALASTGTGVAHCPSSNARLGAGICRVSDLRRAGVAVGLGVDGAASSEDGGVLADVKMALYLARLRSGKAEGFATVEALQLATEGGAQCLGRKDIGTLTPGSLADIAVWPAEDLADMPVAVDALVLGPERQVRHLLVGGELVVEDGHLTRVDGKTVRAELISTAHRLWTDATEIRV